MWLTLSLMWSHIKHFKILNPELPSKMLWMGDSSDWDHFEKYKTLKIEVKDQTFPFSSESHVEFGLKHLCIYMKHNCVGETNLSLIIIKFGTCSLSNEKATVRTKQIILFLQISP